MGSRPPGPLHPGSGFQPDAIDSGVFDASPQRTVGEDFPLNQEDKSSPRPTRAGTGLAKWMLPILVLGLGPHRSAETQNSPALTVQGEVEEFGGRKINLLFDGHPAFVLLPKGDPPADPRAWIW